MVPASLFCQNKISHFIISADVFLKPQKAHQSINNVPFPRPPLILTHSPEGGPVIDGLRNVGLPDTAGAATDPLRGVTCPRLFYWKYGGVMLLPTSTCGRHDQPQGLSDRSPPFLSYLKCLFVCGRQEKVLRKFQRHVES